jgi:hypothetical protein
MPHRPQVAQTIRTKEEVLSGRTFSPGSGSPCGEPSYSTHALRQVEEGPKLKIATLPTGSETAFFEWIWKNGCLEPRGRRVDGYWGRAPRGKCLYSSTTSCTATCSRARSQTDTLHEAKMCPLGLGAAHRRGVGWGRTDVGYFSAAPGALPRPTL